MTATPTYAACGSGQSPPAVTCHRLLVTIASPPHGFGEDARSRWLRQRPTPAAMRWVERSLQVTVTGYRAYRGGASSSIHGVRVVDGVGRRTVVLRRYIDADVLADEPDIAAREARVLQALARAPLQTPELLAVDDTGNGAGVPALLMSRIPGRVVWSPPALEQWLHELAATLPPLHATSIADSARVQEFVAYDPPSWEPPDWFKDRRLWDRALTFFHGPRLDQDRVFIHRDYHPGNVLWLRGKVSGVVDWQAASLGPRAVDVWHCRGNLLGRFGLDVADRFVKLWEQVSGHAYNPWAETVMLVDAIGWLGPRTEGKRQLLERLLARRLAEFGA